MKFLSQIEAINLDQELFNVCQFSVDQLMELAGLSVATAIYKSGSFDPAYRPPEKVLVICGPGNNGGDGLVAARHLKLFGYTPSIIYPKQGKNQLFSNLIAQCKHMNIQFISDSNSIQWNQYKLIVDAVFGFSYKPPLRPEFYDILHQMSLIDSGKQKLISIDIPSGWHVEDGPSKATINVTDDSTTFNTPILQPDCLISLTAPKKCSKYFEGKFHWIGGRFVPPSLAQKYQLNLPNYEHTEQCLLLTKK